MKKKVLVCASVIALFVVGFLFWLFLGKPYYEYREGICNVDINNLKTKGMKYSEINNLLKKNSNYVVDDLDLSSCISYNYSKDLKKLKKVSFSDYRKRSGNSVDLVAECSLNSNKLKEFVTEYNKDKLDGKSADFKVEDNRFKLVDEVLSEKLDYDVLNTELSTYINDNNCITSDCIDLNTCKIPNEVTNEIMCKYINNANKYAEWKVTYSDGKEYSLDASKDINIVRGEDKKYDVTINNEALVDIVNDVAKNYNTIGKDWDFKTNTGKEVKVSGGTWGNEVNKDKELTFLQDSLVKYNSVDNRTPEYTSNSHEDIGNTYVEVSISDQHVWVHKDGKVIMESDVVTGKCDGKHETPTGVFYISERMNGKVLKPKGASTGTKVNKWMRVTWDGVGLHDASWRYNFGGKIYKTNGSHGCVNLPKKFAYELFEVAYVGMPVIIY